MLLENLDYHHPHLYHDLPLSSPCSPPSYLATPSSPHTAFTFPIPASPTAAYLADSRSSPTPSSHSPAFSYFQCADSQIIKEEPWTLSSMQVKEEPWASVALDVSASNSFFPSSMVLSSQTSVQQEPSYEPQPSATNYSQSSTASYPQSSIVSYPHSTATSYPQSITAGYPQCSIAGYPQPSTASYVPSATSSYPTTTRNSLSPMVLSPALSNLNTPRVSLSSQCSDFSTKLRSNHSSLHSSPLGFMEQSGMGGFGHSVAVPHDLSVPETSQQQSGYITPPRSGYSSPLLEMPYHPVTAPPSYEESVQNFSLPTATSPYPLRAPYPYDQMTGGDPALGQAFTPDPDWIVGVDPPDTPDSSVKEEPSEELGEEGTRVCRFDIFEKACRFCL